MTTPAAVETEMPEDIGDAELRRQIAGQAVMTAAQYSSLDKSASKPVAIEFVESHGLNVETLLVAVLELKRQNSELHSELESQDKNTVSSGQALEMESAISVLKARTEGLESELREAQARAVALQAKLDDKQSSFDAVRQRSESAKLDILERHSRTVSNLAEALLYARQ